MAKKRRDLLTSLFTPIASPRAANFARLPSVTWHTNLFAMSLIEDRRTHYPGLKPFKRPVNRPVQLAAVGRPARLHLVENDRYKPPSQTKALVAFQEPKKVPICVRRGVRREVIHAKGVAGSKNLRKPRRNQWSDVSCRS